MSYYVGGYKSELKLCHVRSGHFGSSEHNSAADLVGSTDWNVGLAIEVENFSGKLLTDPRQHVVCGWKVRMSSLDGR